MDRYRIVEDLTSDVMFEAYGESLPEVLENAAEAMCSVICDLDSVEQKESRELEVRAETLKDLMVAWLQEVIATVDVEEMFFSRFEVLEVSGQDGSGPCTMKARIWGEAMSPEKGGTVVKAVSYHKYLFEEGADGWKARVVLDI